MIDSAAKSIFFAAVAVALCTGRASGQEQARLIDVGDHRLFLDCSGADAGPTVIFEAGSGRTGEDWTPVQAAVGTVVRACRYDRAGLGKSDKVAAPETAAQAVEDLHQLLTNAHLAPPYILVGHSQGGIFVRRYTTQCPLDVAGLVFVDSAHEEQFWRVAAISPEWSQRVAVQFSGPEMLRQGFLPPKQQLVWHFDVPLIVIEHAPPQEDSSPMNQQSEAVFRSLQRDLASRSKYGEVRTADGGGHYIQLDQPELVTQAIEDVIRTARGPATKSN